MNPNSHHSTHGLATDAGGGPSLPIPASTYQLALREAFGNDIPTFGSPEVWMITQSRTKDEIMNQYFESLNAQTMRSDWLKDLARNAKPLLWFALMMAFAAAFWWGLV